MAILRASLLLAVLSWSATAATTGGPEWSYGQFGLSPDHWGDSFPTCGNGLSQSGIDIPKGNTTAIHDAIKTHYSTDRHTIELVHEGLTIQLDLAELEEEVHYNGATWGLLQVSRELNL
jgi:carbonic anhydrase